MPTACAAPYAKSVSWRQQLSLPEQVELWPSAAGRSSLFSKQGQCAGLRRQAWTPSLVQEELQACAGQAWPAPGRQRQSLAVDVRLQLRAREHWLSSRHATEGGRGCLSPSRTGSACCSWRRASTTSATSSATTTRAPRIFRERLSSLHALAHVILSPQDFTTRLARRVAGQLKVCSHSVYFVPRPLPEPILRIPYRLVSSICRQVAEAMH